MSVSVLRRTRSSLDTTSCLVLATIHHPGPCPGCARPPAHCACGRVTAAGLQWSDLALLDTDSALDVIIVVPAAPVDEGLMGSDWAVCRIPGGPAASNATTWEVTPDDPSSGPYLKDRFRLPARAGAGAGFLSATRRASSYARALAVGLDGGGPAIRRFYRAGLRSGRRTRVEARAVYDSLPARLRMLGPREAVRNLRGFDWSHRVPHAAGGTGTAANGIFERAGFNRKRGAVPMTAVEVESASRDLARVGVAASLRSLGRAGIVAAASAAVVESVFSTVDHGTRYRRGEVTARQAVGSVARDTAAAAAGAALATAAVVGTCVVFPPTAAVLGGKAGLALGAVGVVGTTRRAAGLVSKLLRR